MVSGGRGKMRGSGGGGGDTKFFPQVEIFSLDFKVHLK